MTLQKIRAGAGGFIEGTRLLASEMDFLQDEYIKAIDGHGGGVYPNASQIELEGDFQVDGTFYADGNAVFSGNLNIQGVGSLTVEGDTQIGGDVLITGTTTTITSDVEITASAVDINDATLTLDNTDLVIESDSSISLGGTQWITVDSRSVVKMVPMSAVIKYGATSAVTRFDDVYWRTDDYGRMLQITSAPAQPSQIVFDITNMLPFNSVLTDVRAFIQGDYTDGHASLPTFLPSLQAYKIDRDTGVETALAARAYDASASVAAYDTHHTVSLSGLSYTNAGTDRIIVSFWGEYLTNAEANEMLLKMLNISYTVTQIRY